MSWSEKPNLAPGTYPNGGQLEAIVDQIELLTNTPMAILSRTAAQSLANNTIVAASFDTETLDTHGGFDLAAPTRYTARMAGYYAISGIFSYAANGTGVRTAQMAKNGTDLTASQTKISAVTGAVAAVPLATLFVSMVVGDYLEFQGFQNSGGSLNTSTEGNNIPTLYIRWIAAA